MPDLPLSSLVRQASCPFYRWGNRLKIIKKDHTFFKWPSLGSSLVHLTQEFVFPLLLPPQGVPALGDQCSSKSALKPKDRRSPLLPPRCAHLRMRVWGIRKPEAWAARCTSRVWRGGSEDLERPSSDKQRNVTHFWSVVGMEAISRLDTGIGISHDNDDSDNNHSSHLLRLDPGLGTNPVHAGGF